MVYKNKKTYNSYLNTYMKLRYQKRRDAAIIKLGGKCVSCGTTDNLEFDHIYPSTKFKTMAKMSSYSEKRFNEELEKCQLLCTACHKVKTRLTLSSEAEQLPFKSQVEIS